MKLLPLVDSGSSLPWIDKTSGDQLNLQGVKRSLTVSGINGTECHESEIVNVTIHLKDYGDEDIQMAIHQKLVIGESFYDIRKMQSQYPQLTKVPSKETLEKTTHCENDRYTVGILWNSPRSRLPKN